MKELKVEGDDSSLESCLILEVCLLQALLDSMEGVAKYLGSTVVG